MGRFLASSLASLLLATLPACAVDRPSNDDGVVDRVQQGIANGAQSGESENFVLAGLNRAVPLNFTAVLVAPTLALTARHNITSDSASGALRCFVGTNVSPPEAIELRVGAEQSAWRVVKVKRVLVDLDKTTCDVDFAALELAEPINIPTPSLALDALPEVGDPITAIGWGMTERNDEVGHATSRVRRTGPLLGTDGAASYLSQGHLASADLPQGTTAIVAADVSHCPADSGGAMLDKNGALTGIITMRLQGDPLAKACVDATGIGTSVKAHAAFVERAFQSIGRMPPRSGKPLPSELGGACTDDKDCHSNFCVGIGQRSMCSRVCQNDSDCGSPGLICSPSGHSVSGNEVSVCLDQPTMPAEVGCAAGGSSSNGLLPVLAGVGCVVLFRRKKRPGSEQRSPGRRGSA